MTSIRSTAKPLRHYQMIRRAADSARFLASGSTVRILVALVDGPASDYRVFQAAGLPRLQANHVLATMRFMGLIEFARCGSQRRFSLTALGVTVVDLLCGSNERGSGDVSHGRGREAD